MLFYVIIVLKFQIFKKEEEKLLLINIMKSWIEIILINIDREELLGLMFRFYI